MFKNTSVSVWHLLSAGCLQITNNFNKSKLCRHAKNFMWWCLKNKPLSVFSESGNHTLSREPPQQDASARTSALLGKSPLLQGGGQTLLLYGLSERELQKILQVLSCPHLFLYVLRNWHTRIFPPFPPFMVGKMYFIVAFARKYKVIF